MESNQRFVNVTPDDGVANWLPFEPVDGYPLVGCGHIECNTTDYCSNCIFETSSHVIDTLIWAGRISKLAVVAREEDNDED